MNQLLLLAGVVIVACILMNRIATKLPIPSLLIFIALGMCFGVNGFFKISFDDYALSESICSACLIFIMFYGGFGTNVKEAKPVAVQAFLLSTAGVVMTAGLVGIFAHYFLNLGLLESLLIGSVIASTDAASVFNVLRSKKLSLKHNTDSLLELESGSNDPISYMLTILMISLIMGKEISVPLMLFKQITFGVICGLLIGKFAAVLLNRVDFYMEQGKTIFLFAIAIIAYALPSVIGGNGYLSVYLCGIFLGNSFLPEKKDMVRFFDALTEIAQMMIFFLLGLLVTPVELPAVFIPAVLICVFMIFVGRPIAMFLLLKPFGASVRQIGVVSWAGLRGVASIVFSIYVVLEQIPMKYDLFNLVFLIVLISLSVQGTLLPLVSHKLAMIDANANVMKTFNDFQEESDVSFVKVKVAEDHRFANRKLKDITMPPEFLVTLIIRGSDTFLPDGETMVEKGDILVFAAPSFEDRENLTLYEMRVGQNHKWKNKALKDIPRDRNMLIIMVKRNDKTIIPRGDTVICKKDTLVIAHF